MKFFRLLISFFVLLCAFFFLNFAKQKKAVNTGTPLFVTDVKIDLRGEGVFMSQKGTKSVVLYSDDFSDIKHEWVFNETPTGIAVTNKFLYVTTFETKGLLHIIDLSTNVVLNSVLVGSGAVSPILSPDNKTVYVCDQYSNSISKVDLGTQQRVKTVAVLREPRVAAISRDGSMLYVANYLPAQPANLDTVAASISVIRLKDFKKIKDIRLTNGSNALQGLSFSPDDNYLFCVHNLGRFQVPTSQLQQGWMNTSGMSVVNLKKMTNEGAILLDEPERGAGGLWSVHTNENKIFISQFGTHELSIIDYPAFLAKYLKRTDKASLSYDLQFLQGIREQIKLVGNGPRAFAVNGDKVVIPTYFSDTVNIYSLKAKSVEAISLVSNRQESDIQKGEKYFNDASYCYQSWQSCNGCHPGEARTDGMNWDLMNDGIGNPKNCKSMILAHATPPSMISGIRASAQIAVRKGFSLIQFHDIPEEKALCVDQYLSSLKPVPSPYLVDGKLSAKAVTGRKVFERLNCVECHSGPYYTDMKMHRVGDDVEFENGWDTPTLIEVWRTAPYLYNGRAATLHEVFEKYKHGVNTKLNAKELDALVEYVNSL